MNKGFASFDSFMVFPFDFTTPEIKRTQIQADSIYPDTSSG